jgi:RND superfamily putative drug exporter
MVPAWRFADLARLIVGRRTKYAVLLGVVAILAFAGPLAGKIADVEDNGPTSMLPRDAQSTQVEEELPAFAHDGVLPVVVVIERDSGLTPTDRAWIESLQGRLEPMATDDPAVRFADDDEAATITFGIDTAVDDWPDRIDEARKLAAQGPAGLVSHVTGTAAVAYDGFAVFDGIDGKILAGSVLVVTIVLLLTYRSPVLWLLPLVSIAAATVLSQALIYLLAKHADMPVNGQSGGILPILTFGVGTDYALLMIARYREELAHAGDRHAAMAVALRRTAATVLASAATVVLGLSCLMLADINSTRSLGAVGAVAVACAALALLTVLPALLVVLGRWVFWPYVPRVDPASGHEPTRSERRWGRVADAVSRAPRRTWLATAGVLVLLAFPAAFLDVGATEAERFLDPPDSTVGQQVLADHFPAGGTSPVEIVAQAQSADEVRDVARSTPGIDDVGPARVAADGERVLVTAVLADAPDSESAEATVRSLRDALAALTKAEALVGGPTAQRADVEDATIRDSLVVMPAVLVVVLLVLALLLRAVVGPVVLLASVVLSYVAALGVGGLVLELLGYGAVDISLPLLAFCFLVALGVDYTIFLTSRIREEVGRHGHALGVRRGLVATGGVVTSAGIVLAATFGVLWQFPILVQLGVVVSLGVLLDTFVTRSLLVPALALELGPRFWWPSTDRTSSVELQLVRDSPMQGWAVRSEGDIHTRRST